MEEEEDKLKEFPDVTQKLAAPKKLSAFEKERQAAQAKQQRAEAENAAALKAFEDSFADEDDDDDLPAHLAGGRGHLAVRGDLGWATVHLQVDWARLREDQEVDQVVWDPCQDRRPKSEEEEGTR